METLENFSKDDIYLFYSKIDKNSNNNCWLWKGNINKRCCRFILKNKVFIAKEFMYFLKKDNLFYRSNYKIVNSCKNVFCVNPEHLSIIDNSEIFKVFMNKVSIPEEVHDCWIWSGYKNKKGYGYLSYKGKSYQAHVTAYKLLVKDFPSNNSLDFKNKLCVLHECDNPSCVNPLHLFLGTNEINVLDRVKKGRGALHKLTLANVKNIKILLNKGLSQKFIASKFDVSQAYISTIKLGKVFKYV